MQNSSALTCQVYDVVHLLSTGCSRVSLSSACGAVHSLHVCVVLAGVSGQAWATYLPAEKAPTDGSKPRGATVFARDFQTVVIYDAQGKFVGVRRPGSALPIQVSCSNGPCVLPVWCW